MGSGNAVTGSLRSAISRAASGVRNQPSSMVRKTTLSEVGAFQVAYAGAGESPVTLTSSTAIGPWPYQPCRYSWTEEVAAPVVKVVESCCQPPPVEAVQAGGTSWPVPVAPRKAYEPRTQARYV